MHHLEVTPPETLRNAIKCFWYDKLDFGEQQSGFEVVPDGYAELIFYVGNSCSISYGGALQPLPSPFMVGLLNQPVYFYAQNQVEIIAVRCFPWTVFDLLGLPSGNDGVRVVNHPIAQLQTALAESVQSGRKEEALAQLETYFLNNGTDITTDSTLHKAGVALRETKGTIPVSQVATAAHATVRTLERKFKQSSGFTVKDVSSLIRFEQVRNQLWLDPTINLAGLAHELGYTDQAHLSREFKRFSGTSPAAFARKAKKGKQVVVSDFVAFVQD